MCLDRARQLPTNLRRSQLHLVEALLGVMSLIFDRNASLLPGYFIVNELLKLYPDYKNWPHWVSNQGGSLCFVVMETFWRFCQMCLVWEGIFLLTHSCQLMFCHLWLKNPRMLGDVLSHEPTNQQLGYLLRSQTAHAFAAWPSKFQLKC